MRILSGRYNEQVNSVDIVNHENGYFLRLDCGKWEMGNAVANNPVVSMQAGCIGTR